jgi:hypothetical protein
MIRLWIARLGIASMSILAADCVALRDRPPKMPFSITTAAGTVNASTADEAQHVAELVEAYAPRVQAILGTGGGTLPEITVVQGIVPGHNEDCGGACYKPVFGRWLIVLRWCPDPLLHHALVHELVHFYSTGIWERLSPTMQEGFADEVSSMIVPADAFTGPRFLLMSALFNNELWDPRPLIDRGPGEFYDLDLRTESSSRGIGYYVAYKLGIEKLRELCVQAEERENKYVSAQDLLEAAGLPLTDTRLWFPGLATQVTEPQAKASPRH